MSSFSDLPFSEAELANLEQLGFTRMTPIQAQALPPLLEGRDVIAQASTGSGKTLAFALSLLNRIVPGFFGCQALVLCPTRELADQVATEIRRLARAQGNVKGLTLSGGMAMGPQQSSLEHGAHVVVGTPGRVLKHLEKGTLQVRDVNTLVLDEADRMLDMGFVESIADIINQLPEERQTLLFSATFPPYIQEMADNFMQQPLHLVVEKTEDAPAIEQRFYQVKNTARADAVVQALYHFKPESALVFCFTKQQCEEVTAALENAKISARALHGDMEQRDRDRTLIQFANKSLRVLVATDVAARGLDIENVELVINAETARDSETHVHRIGRTARAGKTGLAITFSDPTTEQKRLDALEAMLGGRLPWHSLVSLKLRGEPALLPTLATLNIGAGKKDKIRPGDILGALTGDGGFDGNDIGKIVIHDTQSYVAVAREKAKAMLEFVKGGKIKGKTQRARLL